MTISIPYLFLIGSGEWLSLSPTWSREFCEYSSAAT